MAKKLEKDYVCGMDVDPEKVTHIQHKGKTYYFCSPTCQWAFEKNPEQFIQE